MKAVFCLASLTFSCFQVFYAHATCDFDKPVGSCEGSVTILSTAGSAPSFSAEIQIGSSTGACSKVEYRINSMPVTSIIRSTGPEHESLFGTKPIKRDDIEVLKCTAYEGAVRMSAGDAQAAGTLTGTWLFTSTEQASGSKSKQDISTRLEIVESNGTLKGKAFDVITGTYEYEGTVGSPVTSKFTNTVRGTINGDHVILEVTFEGKSRQENMTLDRDVLRNSNGAVFRRIE